MSRAGPGRAGAGGPITLADYDAVWLDELVPMWRASFEAGVGIVDPHPLEGQRQYFLDHVLPQNAVCLALRGPQLLGFAAASRESVAQLFVRVGEQRHGIGTQLLDWAKRRSDGSLWLYTFARNRGARAFYARSGFTEIAHGFEPTWKLDDVKLQWSGAHGASWLRSDHMSTFVETRQQEELSRAQRTRRQR